MKPEGRMERRLPRISYQVRITTSLKPYVLIPPPLPKKKKNKKTNMQNTFFHSYVSLGRKAPRNSETSTVNSPGILSRGIYRQRCRHRLHQSTNQPTYLPSIPPSSIHLYPSFSLPPATPIVSWGVLRLMAGPDHRPLHNAFVFKESSRGER